MKLRTYVNKRLNEFQTNLDEVVLSLDKEAIHDLRVALKRIFALRKILKSCVRDYNESYAFYFLEVKTIFKYTGIIRDNQLMIENAIKCLNEEEYMEFSSVRNEQLQTAKKGLYTYLNSIDLKRVRKDLLKVFGVLDVVRAEYMIKVTQQYTGKNEGRIVLQFNTTNCNYHLIRKWVKEQFYLLQVLNDVFKINGSYKLINRKKELGKVLGDWHDIRVLERHLKDAALGVSNHAVAKLDRDARNMLKCILRD
jgi:CHAD domain-containing protein